LTDSSRAIICSAVGRVRDWAAPRSLSGFVQDIETE
jgi:hypothetical protein